MKTIDIYLETGSKKVFAGAQDWPGWCRAGRDEAGAVQALLDYASRYARVMRALKFQAPGAPDELQVVERLPGGSATDFGVPEAITTADRVLLDDASLARQADVLRACWQAFDAAAQAAAGKELTRGPRGGGRDLESITRHVMNSSAGYLKMIGVKIKLDDTADLSGEWARANQAVLDGLEQAMRNGIPAHGSRGGKTWPARYFVRRLAWHVLDHVWEIEDRIH